LEILGHIVGVIAVICFFVSYQIHDKKRLLILQTFATGLICLQYILIGAYSGFALNIICICRNLCFCNRDKKIFSGLFFPIFFAVLMAVVSAFSWDGWYSLFIVSGLMLNTVCLGILNAQNIRKSILISCPLIILYNLFAGSYSGIVNESISIVSAVIGIVRYNKEKKA